MTKMKKAASHQKDIFHLFQTTYFTYFRKRITLAQLKNYISLVSEKHFAELEICFHSLQNISQKVLLLFHSFERI